MVHEIQVLEGAQARPHKPPVKLLPPADALMFVAYGQRDHSVPGRRASRKMFTETHLNER